MLGENQAMFKAKSVVLTTRLIDGNFPEYSRLLPESFEMEFDIPAQALRESLKRANLCSGASDRSSKGSTGGSPGAPVRFAFSSEEGTLAGGRLTISSKSADTGEAAESLEARLPDGVQGFVVAFNGRYIAEGVHEIIATGAGSLRLKANESLKPVILCPAPATGEAKEGDKNGKQVPDYTYLIMPMRDPDSADKEE
ncbi:MAG: DNA polymerase III subunit beta [Rubrobacter sp.]|nr:DNA polymerase III subunit beta [Rubrobacter sp.]